MLQNIEAYEHFIHSIAENYSEIDVSKLIVKRKGIHFALVEGEIYFKRGYRLKVFEAVDFDLGRIESYGYEIYRDDEKLYYYDSHPHPNDPLLAKPHHIISIYHQILNIIEFLPKTSDLTVRIYHF